jgi:hypothetical protein
MVVYIWEDVGLDKDKEYIQTTVLWISQVKLSMMDLANQTIYDGVVNHIYFILNMNDARCL